MCACVCFFYSLSLSLQSLCKSDVFVHDPKVSAADVIPFCKKTMTVHKRQVVEQAMKCVLKTHTVPLLPSQSFCLRSALSREMPVEVRN